MVLLQAIKDKASTSTSSRSRRNSNALPHRRRALRNGSAAQAHRHGHHLAHQGHGQPRHRRAPHAAGRPHRPGRSGQEHRLRVASFPPCSAKASCCASSTVQRRLDLEKIGMATTTSRSSASSSTSPTASSSSRAPRLGKTTTLYAALYELNSIEDKLITTERPGRIRHRRASSSADPPGIELTFGSCLRSILRQDPDIVLVGEIRDKETAVISIQASLTGHLSSRRCTPTTPPRRSPACWTWGSSPS